MSNRAVLVIALALGCGTSPPAAVAPRTFGGDRPVDLQIPDTIEPGKRYPLVVVLHGFGAIGRLQEAYFGISGLPARNVAFVLAPEGTPNSTGKQFWNADPRCCDFERQNPDDVAYLGGVIDEVSAAWPIDGKQVMVIGHSNGGFMAYRLACDRADAVSHIVVLAGEAASTACAPSRGVNVLHVHGTLDDSVAFTGAAPSVQKWTGYNGCAGPRDPGAALDVDSGLAGAETRTETARGCPAGSAVALWTMEGASHIPALSEAFQPAVWQWFTGHPRP
jgi:polyhydroxybutyrate depolymerase